MGSVDQEAVGGGVPTFTAQSVPEAFTPDWHAKPQSDLEAAIAEFKAALPGWWYSVCECQVSCDASCAPTTESPDVALIDRDPAFDSGFHADLRQPSSLAEALRDVMDQALAAKASQHPDGGLG